MNITSCTKQLLNDMSVEENRQRVHMYEEKLVRIWDKIRQLEVTKMRLNISPMPYPLHVLMQQ
jgi:hypothetical protein